MQMLWNCLRGRRWRGPFQTQEMVQASFGILQDLIGLIQPRKGCARYARVAAARLRIRVRLQGLLMVAVLQLDQVEPRCAWLIKKREIIDHAAKLSPQEQCATAFGFVTLNPP